jgi:hypothetical protein
MSAKAFWTKRRRKITQPILNTKKDGIGKFNDIVSWKIHVL